MIGALATSSAPLSAFLPQAPGGPRAGAAAPAPPAADQRPVAVASPSAEGSARLSSSLLLALQQAGDEPSPLDEARASSKPAEPIADLDSEEQAIISDLRARDAEVRAHEAAHARVGGEFAGAPQFTFETGPDGRLYAVAGEVSIDTSPVPGDAEATIEKLETVIRAALAPAEPSSQDLAVAAQARSRLAEARAEARTESREGQQSAEPSGADAVIGALANLIA